MAPVDLSGLLAFARAPGPDTATDGEVGDSPCEASYEPTVCPALHPLHRALARAVFCADPFVHVALCRLAGQIALRWPCAVLPVRARDATATTALAGLPHMAGKPGAAGEGRGREPTRLSPAMVMVGILVATVGLSLPAFLIS